MAKRITKIKLGSIVENPLNIHTEDNNEQIKLMAESINMIGLESPLVVYEDKFAGKPVYVILSGHKRYKALKAAGKAPIFEVACVVEEKPKNEVLEREALLQNNIARKDPQEIQRQAKEASEIWERMSAGRREKYTESFKNQFILEEKKKNGKVPDEKYIRDNFRPRLEYIKRMTGLGVSNRTVTNFLKRELIRTSEALPLEPTKEKVIRINDIIRRIDSLSGLIGIYLGNNSDSTDEKEHLEDLQLILQKVSSELSA